MENVIEITSNFKMPLLPLLVLMEYFTNLLIFIEPDHWLVPPVNDTCFHNGEKILAQSVSTHSSWKHYKNMKL